MNTSKTKPRILVTCKTCGAFLFSQLSNIGEMTESPFRKIRPLKESELIEELRGKDIVVAGTDPYTADVINEIASSGLRMIARFGVGLDNIDLAAATRNGILVTYAPKASSNSVAEFAVSVIFGLSKRLVEADASVRTGKWLQASIRGYELEGKVAGIIGFGTIGRKVGELLEKFGLQVIVYDPFIHDEPRLRDFEYVLRNSDILTIHSALTSSAKHLIGEKELAMMKPASIIVNTARGGIVDETALNSFLKEGRIGGAALDVFEREPPEISQTFAKLPNVILTPHIAGNTWESSDRMDHVIVEDVTRFLLGEKPIYPANPEVLSTLQLN